MGRISDLIAAERSINGPTCRVRVVLDDYDKVERAEWEAHLADDSIQHTQLARAFKADDRDVKPDSVSRHRRGECACGAD